jgi:hypothetical protein
VLRVFTKASDPVEKRRLMKFVLRGGGEHGNQSTTFFSPVGDGAPSQATFSSTLSSSAGDGALSQACSSSSTGSLEDNVLVVSEEVAGSSTGATRYSSAYLTLCSEFHPQDFLDKWAWAAQGGRVS